MLSFILYNTPNKDTSFVINNEHGPQMGYVINNTPNKDPSIYLLSLMDKTY